MDQKSEDEIRRELEENPGSPVFSDYAESLRERGELSAGLHTCLLGLSSNPAHHLGRLVLARIFFDAGYYPFCVRELKELLRAFPDNQSLASLLKRIAPESETGERASQSLATMAEAEFEFDELELIGQEESRPESTLDRKNREK